MTVQAKNMSLKLTVKGEPGKNCLNCSNVKMNSLILNGFSYTRRN